MAEFVQNAHQQAEFSIECSQLEQYASNSVALIDEILTNMSLSEDALSSLMMRFTLRREFGERHLGLTDGDLVLDGRRSIAG